MSEHEPVTAPDQHKPGSPRAARIGAVVVIIALLAMLVGNNKVNTGAIFLIAAAGLIAGVLVADWLLRKNGLKS